MRKDLVRLVLLVCFELSASAQTIHLCKTASEPANIPRGASVITDYDDAPLEFLFSDHGVDIYSATSYRRPHPLQWIRDNGITVIMVYQDENARRKQIEHLRKSGSLPSRVGFPQNLDNIKYAMLNLFGPSESFVRDLEYFEPKPCVTSSELKAAGQLWMHYSDFQVWDRPGLHAVKSGPNWITGFYSPYLIVNGRQNPVYARIHDTMAARINAYIAKHSSR